MAAMTHSSTGRLYNSSSHGEYANELWSARDVDALHELTVGLVADMMESCWLSLHVLILLHIKVTGLEFNIQ